MMNQLTNTSTIDSREIAEMVEMRHHDLLAKVDSFNEILLQGKILSTNYFIESTYITANNRKSRCYLFTKMGCEFIANKFTGEKGVLFTAKYVKKFNEMEQAATAPPPTSIEDIMIYSLQEMKNVKQKLEQQDKSIEQTNNRIKNIQDSIIVDTKSWRKWVNASINKLAESEIVIEEFGNLRYQSIRVKSYNELQIRANCDLKRRLSNLKGRLEKVGATKRYINNVSNIDIIEQDKKLKEIYTTIIKEMLVKYQAS